LSFCHALVVVLPLLALSATGQVINHARACGALELYLSQPIARIDYFMGVTLVRWGTVALPLAALILGVSLLGRVAFDQQIPWLFVLKATLSGLSLATAFVGIGLMISTLCANQAKAVMLVLCVWIAAVALVDFALIGLMLEWRLQPRAVFALAILNPVEASRLALLSSVDPELGVLGPVGFYLANRLGSAALFATGVALPSLMGAVTWMVAAVGFRRGDAV
jgi:ABC-2 type transport system permease protein